MQALLIILAAIALLFLGYVLYGGWLCKQWGIDPKRVTPAKTKADGLDYVEAKPAVLMGHHFSSIAGAGPINGPIQAAVFGWVPVFLWCIIGGIFFGGVQDFGSLFASIRHDGKTVGEIIRDSMGRKAQKLFVIFCVLVLILVIASFVNVVAGTFFTAADEATGITPFGFTTGAALNGNQTTAIISVLFIVLAVIYGVITNRFKVKTLPATIIGVIGVAAIVFLGLNVGFAMSRTAWIVFIAVYLVVASLLPVWILLQPRDYLSSYLLYVMMALAIVGIVVCAITGRASFSIPAFNGFVLPNGSFMFPTLFITVACGACSGFHALIASGTTSKQLDSESHAKVIGYGSMLIESALGVVALIAVGMVFTQFTDGAFGSPSAAFAAGVATMFSAENSATYTTIYALLTLAVSVFALTSLDTATRLSRFMFSELFLKEGEKTWKDASGIRKLLAHPVFATGAMVGIGSVLGYMKLSAIWGLFGAANQLLAGIALMAVAAWLGNVGKNNKMFFIPMAFMLAATITSLVLTIKAKVAMFGSPDMVWGDYFQLGFATVMVVLAVILVIEGIKTLTQKKAAA
ncbi:MAG: carbon starvation protein A [Lachnospiraceae bacterium]|nr:carbon starvation protein A [Lachnospiraceae bacterium]